MGPLVSTGLETLGGGAVWSLDGGVEISTSWVSGALLRGPQSSALSPSPWFGQQPLALPLGTVGVMHRPSRSSSQMSRAEEATGFPDGCVPELQPREGSMCSMGKLLPKTPG